MLDSWKDSPTRAAIEEYVRAVTGDGPGFVPGGERIATFDNDGTLWSEKPIPIQLDFSLHRMAEMAESYASLRDEQPWKAAYEKDMAWLGNAMVKHYQGDDGDLGLLIGAIPRTIADLNVDAYHREVSDFFETAERWFRRRGGAQGSGTTGHAVLFTTCSVNYSDPVVARSAVAVLEHAGVKVEIVYERCCGMPFTDTGDLDAARRNAARNVADLSPKVEAGAVILVPGPSCSLMLKEEYPRLLGTPEAKRVAAATRDLMEHVHQLAREKKLPRDFQHRLGRVAYHAPCHLRAQNIGFRSRDLLGLVADEVVLVDACSGVDGTWGMQARFHDASLKVADKMLRAIRAAEPDHVATDCPLSALRIEEGLGRKAVHPIVLLRHAYGIPAE